MDDVSIEKNECLIPAQVQVLNIMWRLWEEHVMWTRSFILSTAHNLGDLDAVTNRLLRNPSDFAKVLTPLYGAEKANQLKTLFEQHLLIAAQLVNADKAGNTQAAADIRKKWYANADEIAAYLSSLNPYWNRNTWQSMLYNHLKMTENEAALRLAGRYAEDIAQYDQIEDQALKMADFMGYGILKQFQFS